MCGRLRRSLQQTGESWMSIAGFQLIAPGRARDIIAETLADDPEVRAFKASDDQKRNDSLRADPAARTPYEQCSRYEPVSHIRPHRVLAINGRTRKPSVKLRSR